MRQNRQLVANLDTQQTDRKSTCLNDQFLACPNILSLARIGESQAALPIAQYIEGITTKAHENNVIFLAGEKGS